MFRFFFKYLLIIVLFICFCFIGLVFSLNSINAFEAINGENTDSSLSFDFIWPTPRYKNITSYFGPRKAPTNNAGTYHYGIDIAATQGSEIIAAFSGEITYIGFFGANGYTIRISNGYYTANYSHVSPHFLVYLGQTISKGDIIATVGPKNVYDVPNNKYKDLNGNPTNRCNHWSASSFFAIHRWKSSKSIRLFNILK